jgi:WD40 repeat protein/serine/threonine protein kinase
MSAEPNLLFGLLALQNNLITPGQLASAWVAWVQNKSVPLAEVLRMRGWLRAADEARIQSQCEQQLGQNGGNAMRTLTGFVDDDLLRTLVGQSDPPSQQLATELTRILEGAQANAGEPATMRFATETLDRFAPEEEPAVIPETRLPDQPPPSAPPAPSTLRYAAETRDRYVIDRLHATGGIGVIWVARDESIGRDVALKELRAECAGDRRAVSRFLTEARVTGQLEHPGIVPVYELGHRSTDGQPFYTMRFVKGRTLTDAIRAYHEKRAGGRAGPIDRNELLTDFIAACKTLAYAHSRGVIHRDLKGQNIVLGDFGEVIVLDWGLAKVLQSIKGMGAESVVLDEEDIPLRTMMGQALGTPAFMSPEQAAGRLDLIDHRTDVYSLGAILYEILTGRPPFVGKDIGELLRKVRTEAPARPSLYVPDLSPALDAVCLRALAKTPDARYGSAADLARDVQRCLADEPVEVYRESLRERAARWARHHQALVRSAAAALAVVSAVALTATLLLSTETNKTRLALRNEQDALASLKDEKLQRDQALNRLQRTSYFQAIALADREWERANVARARELLEGCPENLRGWEWYRLEHVVQPSLKGLKIPLGECQVVGVAWSPDGDRLATAGHFVDGAAAAGGVAVSQSSAVKIWDPATGKELATLKGHTGAVEAVAWGPDGTLASASADGTVRLWVRDGSGYRMARILRGHKGPVQALAWSPDGKRLASGGVDHMVRIWNPDQDEPVRVFRQHTGAISAVAWSAPADAAPMLASCGADRKVRIWDASDGREVAVLPASDVRVRLVAWSPDGQRLALAGDDRVVRVWDRRRRQVVRTLEGHTGAVLAIAWSPDGRFLASAGADKSARLWEAATGAEVLALKGDRVAALAWDPSGKRLATASDVDPAVQVWNIPTATDVLLVNNPLLPVPVEALAWDPSGKRLATASDDGIVRVWNTSGTEILRGALGHKQPARAVAWSPDGKRLASVGDDGAALVWDLTAKGAPRVLRTGPGRINGVAWSPDGKELATAGVETVQVWDLAAGRQRFTLKGGWAVAWSPDGKRLATGGPGNTVALWDATDGHELTRLTGHQEPVTAVAWSPDGERLASASGDRTARVWEVKFEPELHLRELPPLKGHADKVTALAWSPNGQRLATASDDATVKIWEVSEGTEALTLRGHQAGLAAVAWSPDGRRLASGGIEGTVRISAAPDFPGRE